MKGLTCDIGDAYEGTQEMKRESHVCAENGEKSVGGSKAPWHEYSKTIGRSWMVNCTREVALKVSMRVVVQV